MVEFKSKVSDSLVVRVQGENVKEAVKQLTVFNDIPNKCPRCEAPTTLKHREYDGNDYFEAVCTGKPQHKVNLGQYKNNDLLFYKWDEDWKTIKEIMNERNGGNGGNGGGGNSYPQNQPRPQQGSNQPAKDFDDIDDDLPF